MCQRSRYLGLSATVLVCCGAPALAQHDASMRQDEVLSEYLESLGAQGLLALQLESRLAGASGDAREDLSKRLVELYSRMLEEAQTLAQRERLERRSRDLLDLVPESASIQLRLELSRSLYEQLEPTVERWRIGRASEEEVASAVETLRTLGSELHELGVRSDKDAVRLGRQEERADAESRGVISTRLQDAQRRRSVAFYLAGWSNLAAAELTGTPHLAQEALSEFGWLLGAQFGKIPTRADLNAGLLHYEHVARSALGVSVCHSVLGNAAESMLWLEAIDKQGDLAASVRAQLPTWRIVVLGRARAYDDLRTELQRMRWDADAQQEVPLTTGQSLLVLASVGGEGATWGVRGALRDGALEDLLLRGSLRDFSRSAQEYGAEGFEAGGFAELSAAGLGMYYRAIDREPSAGAFDLRVRASATLLKASEARDADRFVRAVGPVLLAAGSSLRDAALWQMVHRPRTRRVAVERLERASEVLERSSRVLSDERASADALWLSVRCLDDASSNGGQIDSARRAALVQRFLELYPGHPNASSLLVSEAAQEESDDAMILRLSSIGPDSQAYETARRKLAQLLFGLFRDATDLDRQWAAQRYVDVAEPIVFDDAKQAIGGDAQAAGRALVRGQRVLAALLGAVQPDVPRVQRVLSVVWEVQTGGLAQDDASDALWYREGQLAIVRDDDARVEEVRTRLESGNERASALLDSLDREVFRRAVVRFRDAQREGAGSVERSDAVLSAGRRVLLRAGIEWPVVEVPGAIDEKTLIVISLCAQAAHDEWKQTDDGGMLEAALGAHRVLRDAGVTDPDVLRRLALLAERAGALDEGVETWSLIASGVERGSADWFEARYNIIRLVARRDSKEGAALLVQHAGLYPELGPPPWDKAFGELATTLGVLSGGGGAP